MATPKKKPEDLLPRGRKTLYDKKYVKQAYRLSLLGLTDPEMAEVLDVCDSTFDNWKNKYPDFLGAIKDGKLTADSNVVASLYERACGYSHPEEKIFNDDGTILRAPTTKHYPPDTAAAFIWLKNRQGWSDKQVHDHNHNFSGAKEGLMGKFGVDVGENTTDDK